MQLLRPQRFLQSFLSQLDLLTHDNEDLCSVGGGRSSVSVGARPENKAQTELSNTPFHWSLSSLSASAAGGKAHLPDLNACLSLSVYVHARLYRVCPCLLECAILFLSFHLCVLIYAHAFVRGANLLDCAGAPAIIGWLAARTMAFQPGHLTQALNLIGHGPSEGQGGQGSQNLRIVQGSGHSLACMPSK